MPRRGNGIALPITQSFNFPIFLQEELSPPQTSIPLAGLSLWLKADTGVSKFSYNYVSQIVISGTSNPSFSGTYTANGVPAYNFEQGVVSIYSFTGPAGKTMTWSSDDGYFLLGSSGEPSDSFYSNDGVNWIVYESYITQVVITGFTGIYSGANGTYNGSGSYFTRVGGGFYIEENGLRDSDTETIIATAPVNYSGSWTPTNYTSSVILAGAGTTSVNGTYTRTDTQINMDIEPFYGSGGKSIEWNGDEWATEPSNWYLGGLITWVPNSGASPAPTGSTGTSARSVGSPTSTTVTTPTGSISGSVITSTVNTDIVSSWADQSGNGLNVAPDYGTTDISLSSNVAKFNNKPAILFGVGSNGGDIGLFNNSPFIGKSVFIVYSLENVSGFEYSVPYENNGINTYTSYEDDSTPNQKFGGYFNGFFNSDTTSTLGTTYLRTVIADDDEEGNNPVNFFINGTEDGSVNGGGFFNSRSQIVIGNGGARQAGPAPLINQPFQGYITEIVVYNRVLTTPERQQVEAYLMNKYDICMDTAASVLMTGWFAGPRTLAPIGYLPYGNETYIYGDEVVRYETGVWIYENSGLGEIARAYSFASRPWLAEWPVGFTATKVCPPT